MDFQFYTANAVTDKIVFGDQLQNGMRVLVAESIMRGHSGDDAYSVASRAERNCWCKVTELRQRNNVVTFVGVYDDGSMRVRTYNKDDGWIVKLDSIPAGE